MIEENSLPKGGNIWVSTYAAYSHGVLPVPLLNGCQTFGDEIKRILPLHRLPLTAYPPHGLMQAIRIVLDVLQRHRLGADVAAAEGVQRITLDRGDLHVAAFAP